jgi:hypothetical protein
VAPVVKKDMQVVVVQAIQEVKALLDLLDIKVVQVKEEYKVYQES